MKLSKLGFFRADPAFFATSPNIRALPASECDFSEAGAKCFRDAYRLHFNEDNPSLFRRIADVTGDSGGEAAGLEFMLPLFYEKTGRLFDYLPDDTVVLNHAESLPAMESFIHQARQRQKIAAVYENRRTLPVAKLFYRVEDFLARRETFSVLEIGAATAIQSRRQSLLMPLCKMPISRWLIFCTLANTHLACGGRRRTARSVDEYLERRESCREKG